LLDQELSPYGKGRYELANGGDVQLAPRAAVALGMALHELTTNAAKHGALSVPGGNVAVTWELSQAPEVALRLIWRERGGPAIEAHPSRRGFGSQLLERGITAELGGTVDLDFTPAGLEALIVVPLDRPNVPAP
jgi:two-component sensor histidine kinase